LTQNVSRFKVMLTGLPSDPVPLNDHSVITRARSLA
jgi:hypothetical protein